MSSALLIVYLAGAIGTAWRLNASTANRERRPFFSIRCLVWPLTATVFGVLVLDRLAGALVRQAGYRFYGSESRYSGRPRQRWYPLCPLAGHLKPSHARR